MNNDMIRTHGYDPRGPGADRRHGDMAEAVRDLRPASDRLFAEGEHAPAEVPDLVGYLNQRQEGDRP